MQKLIKKLGIVLLIGLIGVFYILIFGRIYSDWKLKHYKNPDFFIMSQDEKGELRYSTDPRNIIELAKHNPQIGSHLVAKAQEAIRVTNGESFLYGVASYGLVLGLFRVLSKRIKKSIINTQKEVNNSTEEVNY